MQNLQNLMQKVHPQHAEPTRPDVEYAFFFISEKSKHFAEAMIEYDWITFVECYQNIGFTLESIQLFD